MTLCALAQADISCGNLKELKTFCKFITLIPRVGFKENFLMILGGAQCFRLGGIKCNCCWGIKLKNWGLRCRADANREKYAVQKAD